MNSLNRELIDRLTEELHPVRAMRLRDGLLLLAMALIASVLLVALFDGIWHAALAGTASRRIRSVLT